MKRLKDSMILKDNILVQRHALQAFDCMEYLLLILLLLLLLL